MSAGGASQLPFPFLCLLVSGGHNLLVLVKGVGHYMQLGTTLDDALGKSNRNSNSQTSFYSQLPDPKEHFARENAAAGAATCRCW